MGKYDLVKNDNVITICQGSDYREKMYFKQPDGTAFNLTDCEVTSRVSNLSGSVIEEFTVSLLPPLTDGVGRRELTHLQTANLTPPRSPEDIQWVWIIKITDANGKKLCSPKGGVIVEPEA